MIRVCFGAVCVLFSLSFTGVAVAQTQPRESANNQSTMTQFDDWFYRCVDVEDRAAGKSARQCEISQIQQVRQGEETITVLSMALALSAAEQAGGSPGLLLTGVAPLNIYLPDGLRYGVDGREVIKTSYRNCNQAGCWAQQRLDAKAVAAFRKGKEGTGHFRLLDGRNVNITFSLKGFSAALDALQRSGNGE